MRLLHHRLFLPLLLIALLLIGGGVYWLTRSNPLTDPDRQLVYTIQPGTAAQLAAGEEVDLLPQTIELTLGKQDVLIIQNQDSEPVQIGPYLIDSGQRFTQQFRSAGTFDLMCSVHQSEYLRIIVQK